MKQLDAFKCLSDAAIAENGVKDFDQLYKQVHGSSPRLRYNVSDQLAFMQTYYQWCCSRGDWVIKKNIQ